MDKRALFSEIRRLSHDLEAALGAEDWHGAESLDRQRLHCLESLFRDHVGELSAIERSELGELHRSVLELAVRVLAEHDRIAAQLQEFRRRFQATRAYEENG